MANEKEISSERNLIQAERLSSRVCVIICLQWLALPSTAVVFVAFVAVAAVIDLVAVAVFVLLLLMLLLLLLVPLLQL